METEDLLNSKLGYSLIEVIIVIFIIGVAFVPILNYFTNSVGYVHEIESRSQAVSISSDIIELMKSSINTETNWTNIDNWDNASKMPIGNFITNLKDNNLISSNYDFSSNYNLLSEYEIDINLSSFDFNGVDSNSDGNPVDPADNDYGRRLEIIITWDDGSETVSTLIRNR